jgi:branched-chain amino acid aminotransferase
LYVCDELFFTGTAVEIGPIVRVDQRIVGTGLVGEVTARLRGLYMDATRGRVPQYKKWLVPAYHPTLAGQAA